MEARPIPTADWHKDGPDSVCWHLKPENCPLLSAHGMARIGVDDTGPGYERVRTSPGGSFIQETESGEGRILLEGKWQKLAKGEVAMAPPRVLNAFYTPAGKKWKCAFVRYEDPPGVCPLINSRSPLRFSGHSHLARTIEGLRDEWEHEREPSMLRHWLALIDGLVRRLAMPWKKDDRLASLWHDVSLDLASGWTLPSLASHTGLSPEHLRRLCLQSLGRTPMGQLTYMRIQRAQELIETSSGKIHSIAREVGYASGPAFSRAFHRCVGIHPSEFRGRA